MHCGAIQLWAKCDCKCDSCSFRAVTAYTRYLNNKTECRKFIFYRKAAIDDSTAVPHDTTKTQLFVRETCFDPGTYLGSHFALKAGCKSRVLSSIGGSQSLPVRSSHLDRSPGGYNLFCSVVHFLRHMRSILARLRPGSFTMD
jgi:hypothetical protein